MVANYYWAITVPPGFADEDVSLSGQRRHAQNSRWPKWTIAPTRAPRHGPDFMHSHELEVGRVGKCTKCGSIKPEVYPTNGFRQRPLTHGSEPTIAVYANVVSSNTITIVQ
jgi:hypothetical protein